MAQGWIDIGKKKVGLKLQGILSTFNGIDIDQRHQYVKVSCQSYRMLKTHVGTILFREVRFQAHRSACCINYRGALCFFLGKLTHENVVGRLGVSYAGTLIVRYLAGPD
jgi:hypothetical protein